MKLDDGSVHLVLDTGSLQLFGEYPANRDCLLSLEICAMMRDAYLR